MNALPYNNQPSISVVVPAYNEEKRLSVSLPRMLTYLRSKHPTFEIIVANDGSTDSTSTVAQTVAASDTRVRVLNLLHRGKGHAVCQGLLAANGELVLFTDADLSTPLEDMELLLTSIQKGADIAIGSRALQASQVLEHQPIWRETMGKAFNLFVQAVAIKGIHDTQCGFKLFRGEAARYLAPLCNVDGFGFDVEILYLARQVGMRIDEVPVRWSNSRESKVRILSDPLQMAKDLLRIRWMHRRAIPTYTQAEHQATHTATIGQQR